MSFKLPAAGLLIGLLVACSETKHDPTVQSTLKQQKLPQSKPEVTQLPETSVIKKKNPFDTASFPQASCGDEPSNNLKDNLLTFYPVFIDYNDNNLKAVKKNYCKDASVKHHMRTKDTEVDASKTVIQVAAFLSQERAEEFKYFLIKKGENAEIGLPIIRVIHPANSLTKPTTNSFKAIAKAAQLTPEKVNKLREIINLTSLRDEIIVPTYVPTGFKPYVFQHPYTKSYTIMYRNASNACFSISIPMTTDSSADGLGNVTKINSLALGKVDLQYTDFVQTSNESISGFLLDAIYPDGRRYSYQFSTPAVIGDIPEENSEPFKECTHVSLSEVVKIVESLQFLYPNNSRNVHFVSH